jgi:hypothetical protein
LQPFKCLCSRWDADVISLMMQTIFSTSGNSGSISLFQDHQDECSTPAASSVSVCCYGKMSPFHTLSTSIWFASEAKVQTHHLITLSPVTLSYCYIWEGKKRESVKKKTASDTHREECYKLSFSLISPKPAVCCKSSVRCLRRIIDLLY